MKTQGHELGGQIEGGVGVQKDDGEVCEGPEEELEEC